MPHHNIRCIFISEFDVHAGPRIVMQAPQSFVSGSDYDSISEYMITKPDLCGKLITVLHPTMVPYGGSGGGQSAMDGSREGAVAPATQAGSGISTHADGRSAGEGGKIICFPVGLQQDKYARNAFLFSVGFVLHMHADPRPYEGVLQKLGLSLYSMEVESELLSRPQRKASLERALPAILEGLNKRGECFVSLDGDTCDTIALKLFPVLPSPPEVRDHDVPVRLRDLDVLMGDGDDGGWDITMRMVAAHIDGIAYVRAIAEEADVDVELVRRALQQLHYYGCITFVDIFQYVNIYATTPRVQLLLRSRALRDACLRFITVDDTAAATLAAPVSLLSAVDGSPVAAPSLARALGSAEALSESSAEGTPGPAVPFEYVYRMYAAFGAGSRVCDVCAQGDSEGMGLDDRKFITFGVMHGLLRRVHKYPIAEKTLEVPFSMETGETGAPSTVAAGNSSVTLASITHLLDGTHSVEEICCSLCISQAELEGVIDRRFVFVLK